MEKTISIYHVGWGKRNKERQKLWYAPDDLKNGRPWTYPTYRCWDDWHWYEGNRHYFPTSSTYYGMAGHNHSKPVRGEQYYDVNIWKKRNDNSRYTLYQSAYTVFNTAGVVDADDWDTRG